MTNAPVKDVKSLMNFVSGGGLKKTGGMEQAGSFGDVMNRARGGLANGQMQASAGVSKVPAADPVKKTQDVVSSQKPAIKETVKRQDATPEQDRQAVEEAGEQLVEEVAKELDVTEEEVRAAMEALGLSPVSLLDPSNLTQLVLQLSGGQDQMALLTDEALFADLQSLLNVASQLRDGLTRELDISPQELQTLVDQAISAGEGQAAEMTGQVEAAQREPVITVEVKAGDETVELSADENGNVIAAEKVTPADSQESLNRENAGGQEQKDSENAGKGTEENTGSANPLLNAMNQNSAAAEVSFEQSEPFFGGQTRDIMDQIMDYMKIQLKPGMDQLEMQLHPESLGTVHIQLTSKGGEVTAQFHVQNEAVKAALESQVSTLQETLKEQGVKVEAIQVTVESHGFESNLWQGQGREENASSQGNRKQPRRINLSELDVNAMEQENADEEQLLAARMMEVNGNTVDYTA